jgi:hypothetical protein
MFILLSCFLFSFSIMDRCIIPYTNAMADKWMDCETCEAKISAKARSCPHCGHSYLRNYGPLRYFSEKQLWKYGAILFAMSSAAIVVFLLSFEYWFNWRVAYIVTLVCCTCPLTHFIVGNKYGWPSDTREVLWWLIGTILWWIYLYFFCESKSS